MARINDNELARRVAQLEGKKEAQNIAQIKETIACTKRAVREQLAPAGRIQPSDVLRWLGC